MDNSVGLFDNYRLLVMSKSPELGKVKTRMQPLLNLQQSVELHCELCQYVLSQWQKAKLCPIDLHIGGNIDLFREQLLFSDLDNLPLVSQCKGDLGEKMSCAISTTLDKKAVRGALLVGTDCPFIDESYLIDALSALEREYDVVIGPANDGGYVLLGMTHYYPELFTNIRWGEDQVFTQTLKKIEQLCLNVKILESLPDIDRPSDLSLLQQEYFPQGLTRFTSS